MNCRLENIVLTIVCVVLGSFQTRAQDFVDHAEVMGVNAVVSGSGSGSGLSTYDFDQDGLDDISLSSSLGELKFYRNTGNGFELLPFGILAGGITEHLIWVDIENDGDLDVYFTTQLGQQFLYINDGNFQFQEATEASGLPTYNGFYFGACFADYDLDGDLDLYTCKYNLVQADPDDVSQYNKLFQNQGDGTFIDVTISAGVFMPPTFSFQSTWLDYNDDGWPDLHVINDRGPVNFFFHNNGDGTFSEIANELNIHFPSMDPMSNSVADFDHDGDLDIYMTNTGIASQDSQGLLLVNQGDESFTESGEALGVDALIHGWGAVWIDADNDSWQDLFFVTENNNVFYYYKSVQGQSFIESNELIDVEEYSTSYCPSRGDFNSDGYADIAIQSKSPHPPYVLMNQGGDNDYIKVTLEGTLSNTQAIGSWVKVYVGNSMYTEYTHCGENYLGQNSQHLIFGLGPDVSVVDSIIVKYPSRHTDTYYDLQSDTAYSFREGETYKCEISSMTLDSTFCEGDSLLIDAGDHASYLWNTGDTIRTIWANSALTYSVTTQNQFGISATDSIVLIENPNPDISALLMHPECHGDSTGRIELINQLSILADSIIWSNELTGALIENITAGPYSYLYIDINGCKTQGTSTLIEPSEMVFFTQSTPATDGNEDGSISITIFGGTEPYEIYFDNELVVSPLTDLEGGGYIFSIYDSNLCSETLSVTVEEILKVQRNSPDAISIYPNPVFDLFHIDTKNEISVINILSVDGKVIKNYIPNLMNVYSLESVSGGLYFLKITFTNGTNIICRVLKK